MHEPKRAGTDHTIHELFVRRWSPYALEPREMPVEALRQCLEAARWAPSSYNEQPWRYIVGMRQDELQFPRILGCLDDANQEWAKNAAALMIACFKETFSKNDKPNRVATYDLGAAGMALTIQATSLGLHVHQMAGVDLERARDRLGVPDGFQPWVAIAIGYVASGDDLVAGPFAQRDMAHRSRRSLSEFVFAPDFGDPAGFVSGD